MGKFSPISLVAIVCLLQCLVYSPVSTQNVAQTLNDALKSLRTLTLLVEALIRYDSPKYEKTIGVKTSDGNYTRVATSLTNGKRSAVGSFVTDENVINALNNNESYSGDVVVFDQGYHGRYNPLFNTNGAVDGFVSVLIKKGSKKEGVTHEIQNEIARALVETDEFINTYLQSRLPSVSLSIGVRTQDGVYVRAATSFESNGIPIVGAALTNPTVIGDLDGGLRFNGVVEVGGINYTASYEPYFSKSGKPIGYFAAGVPI